MLKLQLGVECALDLKQRRGGRREGSLVPGSACHPLAVWPCLSHPSCLVPSFIITHSAMGSPNVYLQGGEPRRRERQPPGVTVIGSGRASQWRWGARGRRGGRSPGVGREDPGAGGRVLSWLTRRVVAAAMSACSAPGMLSGCTVQRQEASLACSLEDSRSL